MPVHLPGLTRRQFLGAAMAAGAAFSLPRWARAEAPALDANRVALLADTHMGSTLQEKRFGSGMGANVTRVFEQVLNISPRPANLIIAGDCALKAGQVESYRTLQQALEPVREAGIDVHLLMGNHDKRDTLREVFGERVAPSPAGDRLASLVQTPTVNWFLLDSLSRDLGPEQLAWLRTTLNEHRQKAASIVLHHNLQTWTGTQTVGHKNLERIGGLIDAKPLLEILATHPRVLGVFYGHTHFYEIKKVEELHHVNLPPVGFVFDEKNPSGWVDARGSAENLTLRMISLDSAHPLHGQTTSL